MLLGMNEPMSDMINGVGFGLYAATNLKPHDPPARGTFEAAERLLGQGAVIEYPHAMQRATVAIVNGKQRIAISKGMSTPRANYFVGEQLSKLYLGEQSWFRAMTSDDQRKIAMGVGGWLAAPKPALEAQIEADGFNLSRLSARFSLTNSGILLLAAEVGIVSNSAIVVANKPVQRRGRRFENFDRSDLRAIAAHRATKTVHKVAIRDEPNRIGLVSMDGATTSSSRRRAS